MNLLRLLLKLCSVQNFREVFDETLVVHLFVEITRIHLKRLLETSSRVSVCEVHHTVHDTWILTLGQLGSDVPNAIILDVFHEKLVPHENAVDV